VAPMSDPVSTGVAALDRKLGGGIPPGTLVALLAEPASQAELFLTNVACQRETVYLTPERTPTAVSAALRERHGDCDDVAVTALDRDAPVADAVQYVERLPDESVLVVDPVGPLERVDSGQFRAFLTTLRAQLSRTDGVAVLHGLKHEAAPAQRHRTEYMADLVFDVVTDADAGGIETLLLVPKFRGGAALTEPVRIELTDRIAVDTSRDIA